MQELSITYKSFCFLTAANQSEWPKFACNLNKEPFLIKQIETANYPTSDCKTGIFLNTGNHKKR